MNPKLSHRNTFVFLMALGLGLTGLLYAVLRQAPDSKYTFDWRECQDAVRDTALRIERECGITLNFRDTVFLRRKRSINSTATDEELKHMTKHPNGLLAYLAYQGLMARNKQNTYRYLSACLGQEPRVLFLSEKGCEPPTYLLIEFLIEQKLGLDQMQKELTMEELASMNITLRQAKELQDRTRENLEQKNLLLEQMFSN